MKISTETSNDWMTDEENLYLDRLTDEIHRTKSDAARWRIIECEGLNSIDIEYFGFDADL